MSKTAEKEKDATVQAVASDIEQKTGMTLDANTLALIGAAVAAAVNESKRDPKAEAKAAEEERNREMVRREEQERIANIKARQRACPHLDAYENYAFCGQRNCLGQYVFLCSQCFKPFLPTDPEYANYIRYVKFEKMGAARQ